MKTLIIGGTGPTGPDIVRKLLDRGHDVSVLHRGTHEPSEPVLSAVEHIHADPHFAETLADGLQGRSFDLVIATYGRMQLNVEACRGRCERFIGIGGNPVHAGHLDRHGVAPAGMRVLADERSPKTLADRSDRDRFAARVRAAEESVFAAADAGAFAATYLRYPIVYGRRSMLGFERGLLHRLRSGRRRIVLPDGGLSIYSRLADRNAAHLIGLVVDWPEIAAGQLYQCADDEQFSVRQWAELVCRAVGIDSEFVPVPIDLARSAWDLLPTGPAASQHTLVDIAKARRELGYADAVRPVDVLTAAVADLWTDATSTVDVPFDPTVEDAVLAAHDRMRAELSDRFGWEAAGTGDARWHPYDHPSPAADSVTTG